MRIASAVTLLALVLIVAPSAAAETVIPVGTFRSVEVSNGGHVVVRHGAVQRVTLVEGDLQCARVRLGDGQRLVIDHTHGCSRGHRLLVEVVTPQLSGVSVSHGGSVQALGAFPDQGAIEAAVEQGGSIDIRSIAADDVEASVYSGGRILITSRKTLAATVESGGVITYWGDVEDVKKSVRDGGSVKRGTAADAAPR
jgi:hypothetical protein